MNGNAGPNGRPGLVLLSGLPGTGKTSFAAALAGAVGAVHVESDAVRRRLFARPTYTPEESAAVFAEVERLAASALRSGRPVIIDATNLDERDRRPFVRLAVRADAPLVAVRLTVPEAVARERLAIPRSGHSEAGVGVYELMRPRAAVFRGPSVVVDSRFPTGSAVDLVRRLLHDRS